MAVIRKDDYGIYAKVGGWIARPTSPSAFQVGDDVAGKHFGGSRTVGMGKTPECERGDYLEYWSTWHEEALEHDPWRQYF